MKTWHWLAVGLIAASSLLGQGVNPPPTPWPGPLVWNRFYDFPEMVQVLHRLAADHPGWLELEVTGQSQEGRNLWVATISPPDAPDRDRRPAMWIDANVHGNEVQGTEVCLYTIWWLLENRDRLPKVRDLLKRVTFHICPTVNPDGRQYWFEAPNTSSSSRSGKAPVDSDRDGRFDEDGPDDLDGDGSITSMRKRVEKGGTHIEDPDEPRQMKRVVPPALGTHVLLGSEGFDNDGDGAVNEDGPGGYDMNRAWPTDWQPEWRQFGAGPYPLYWPETKAVARFMAGKKNLAAAQSYHNAGGMILRGPGADSEPEYPGEDLRVYDEMGKAGEGMLPFYRYLVIRKDLYAVHGGFVNWCFEGQGIFAFTNELWNSEQYRGRAAGADEGGRGRLTWSDQADLGATFRPWSKVQHPEYGEIEVGGFTKLSSRVPPLFMLEEMCHRNMAFTLYHGEEMPELSIPELRVETRSDGLLEVTAEVRNARLIPTRATLARERKIGRPDLATLTVQHGAIVLGGILDGPPLREELRAATARPGRLLIEEGVPSRGQRRLRWFVQADGDAPVSLTLTYDAEKGGLVTKNWTR